MSYRDSSDRPQGLETLPTWIWILMFLFMIGAC